VLVDVATVYGLTVPITVLYGAHDNDVSRAQLESWRRETSGPTNFSEIAGGDHLLGGDAWPKLAQAVRTALT
jgi:surfactin synthase thioesterase subunit